MPLDPTFAPTGTRSLTRSAVHTPVRTTAHRRRAAAAIAIAVALSSLVGSTAAAAPKHLGAPKHLRVGDPGSGPVLVLARAPKHLKYKKKRVKRLAVGAAATVPVHAGGA